MVCGKRCHRELFLNELFTTAPPAERKPFNLTCGHLVDWKWEYMEKRFKALTIRVPLLAKYWDYERLKSKVDKAAGELYARVDAALRKPLLRVALEVFSSVCYIVGHWARWLQGCACHEGSRGPCTCPWAGKRGAELVWGGLDTMLSSIRSYQSPQLKVLLAGMNKNDSGRCLAELHNMSGYVANELDFKLKVLWLELPGKLWGLFGEAIGESADAVNRFTKDLLDHYDHITDKEKVHRVARQFLDEGSKVRHWLEAKVLSGARLADMPELLVYVASYAFATICNRKNEGDHRSIKLEARAGSRVLPPYLCAKLRRKDILEHCDDPDFLRFAGTVWRKRGTRELAASLLAGEVATAKLVRMGWREKVQRIYQFDLCEKFLDTSTMDKLIADFRAATLRHFIALPPPLASTNIMLVQCCKALLEPGTIFSVPHAIFRLTRTAHDDQPLGDFSLQSVLEAVGET